MFHAPLDFVRKSALAEDEMPNFNLHKMKTSQSSHLHDVVEGSSRRLVNLGGIQAGRTDLDSDDVEIHDLPRLAPTAGAKEVSEEVTRTEEVQEVTKPPPPTRLHKFVTTEFRAECFTQENGLDSITAGFPSARIGAHHACRLGRVVVNGESEPAIGRRALEVGDVVSVGLEVNFNHHHEVVEGGNPGNSRLQVLPTSFRGARECASELAEVAKKRNAKDHVLPEAAADGTAVAVLPPFLSYYRTLRGWNPAVHEPALMQSLPLTLRVNQNLGAGLCRQTLLQEVTERFGGRAAGKNLFQKNSEDSDGTCVSEGNAVFVFDNESGTLGTEKPNPSTSRMTMPMLKSESSERHSSSQPGSQGSCHAPEAATSLPSFPQWISDCKLSGEILQQELVSMLPVDILKSLLERKLKNVIDCVAEIIAESGAMQGTIRMKKQTTGRTTSAEDVHDSWKNNLILREECTRRIMEVGRRELGMVGDCRSSESSSTSPSPPVIKILDLCSAPGSKTCQLLDVCFTCLKQARERLVSGDNLLHLELLFSELGIRNKGNPNCMTVSNVGDHERHPLPSLLAVAESVWGNPLQIVVVANDLEEPRAAQVYQRGRAVLGNRSPATADRNTSSDFSSGVDLIVTCGDAAEFLATENHEIHNRGSNDSISHESVSSKNRSENYFDSSKNRSENSFDFVLCDVPCSGDGTCKKNPNKFHSWKPKNALDNQPIQRAILRNGLRLVKGMEESQETTNGVDGSRNGHVIYSTCSLNPVENEDVLGEYSRAKWGGCEHSSTNNNDPIATESKSHPVSYSLLSSKDTVQILREGGSEAFGEIDYHPIDTECLPTLLPLEDTKLVEVDGLEIKKDVGNGKTLGNKRDTLGTGSPTATVQVPSAFREKQHGLRIFPGKNHGAFYVGVLQKTSRSNLSGTETVQNCPSEKSSVENASCVRSPEDSLLHKFLTEYLRIPEPELTKFALLEGTRQDSSSSSSTVSFTTSTTTSYSSSKNTTELESSRSSDAPPHSKLYYACSNAAWVCAQETLELVGSSAAGGPTGEVTGEVTGSGNQNLATPKLVGMGIPFVHVMQTLDVESLTDNPFCHWRICQESAAFIGSIAGSRVFRMSAEEFSGQVAEQESVTVHGSDVCCSVSLTSTSSNEVQDKSPGPAVFVLTDGHTRGGSDASDKSDTSDTCLAAHLMDCGRLQILTRPQLMRRMVRARGGKQN